MELDHSQSQNSSRPAMVVVVVDDKVVVPHQAVLGRRAGPRHVVGVWCDADGGGVRDGPLVGPGAEKHKRCRALCGPVWSECKDPWTGIPACWQ